MKSLLVERVRHHRWCRQGADRPPSTKSLLVERVRQVVQRFADHRALPSTKSLLVERVRRSARQWRRDKRRGFNEVAPGGASQAVSAAVATR